MAVAAELARQLDATLHLLHVESSASGTLTSDQHEQLETDLEEYGDGLKEKPPRLEVYVASGNPPEEIAVYAEGVDARYVVMGTHGRSGIARAILGSVAEAVIRHAPCPVVVVPLRT